MHLFRQFHDHHSGRKHFLIYFLRLFLTIISEFENAQNSFRCGSFWFSIFGQRLLIWTVYHTFLEKKHTEITKNLYYVLSIRRSQMLIFGR